MPSCLPNSSYHKDDFFSVPEDNPLEDFLQTAEETTREDSDPEHQILLEPTRRNTAPCIAWASYHIRALNPNANIVIEAHAGGGCCGFGAGQGLSLIHI